MAQFFKGYKPDTQMKENLNLAIITSVKKPLHVAEIQNLLALVKSKLPAEA